MQGGRRGAPTRARSAPASPSRRRRPPPGRRTRPSARRPRRAAGSSLAGGSARRARCGRAWAYAILKIAMHSGLPADLVAANRILAMEGVLDGYGHVSARSGKDPARFLMSRSVAPQLVKVTDVMGHGPDS